MRVAVYYSNDDLRLEETPTPQPGPGEILLRICASGICGTDVMEWYRRRQAPVVLGHEVTGEVAAVGRGVERFSVGDRVVATHHVPCNDCHLCRSGHASVCDQMRATRFDPGGFAEFVRLAKPNVDSGTFLLPASVSFAEGSFVEPLACAVRGQQHAGGTAGKTVLVMGSGVAGLLHLQLALNNGATRLIATDVNQERLSLAKALQADWTH
jgi:L-iditol 2-dehydrogenase